MADSFSREHEFVVALTFTEEMGKPKKNHSANAAAADEDSLETKDEGELVSIATVKQMLDVQQSMLKTLLDSFISTVNARVDKLGCD